MSTRRLSASPAAAVLAGLLSLLAVSAVAQDGADIAAGKAIFSRFCATCHGDSARGDGPTAAILAEAPPDLSALASSNQGIFPEARIIRRIDGRETVLAHGSPMPVYGAFFEGSSEVQIETDAGLMTVSQPVLAIVRFLRELQH